MQVVKGIYNEEIIPNEIAFYNEVTNLVDDGRTVRFLTVSHNILTDTVANYGLDR